MRDRIWQTILILSYQYLIWSEDMFSSSEKYESRRVWDWDDLEDYNAGLNLKICEACCYLWYQMDLHASWMITPYFMIGCNIGLQQTHLRSIFTNFQSWKSRPFIWSSPTSCLRIFWYKLLSSFPSTMPQHALKMPFKPGPVSSSECSTSP